MRDRGLAWLHGEAGPNAPYRLAYSAEMRYRGQAFELDTPFEPGAVDAADPAMLAEAFHAAHEQVYGHADRGAPLQVISIRLVISGETDKPALPRQTRVDEPAPVYRRASVWMDGGQRDAAVLRRADLRHGHSFTGPAIVTQDDCTTVVPPGFWVTVDEYANLSIKLEVSA